jgi:hypothetical protein
MVEFFGGLIQREARSVRRKPSPSPAPLQSIPPRVRRTARSLAVLISGSADPAFGCVSPALEPAETLDGLETAPREDAMRRKPPRTRRWLRALSLAALGALVLAGIAGAANSGSFTDRPGDVKLAADVTNIDVSNDDAGTITIGLTFGDGGLTPGLPGEDIGVALDLDQNPDTGTVYYGTEVGFALDFGVSGTTLKFERAAGSGFASAPAPASLQGTINGATVTFSVKAADLGLAPNGGFNIVAVSESPLAGDLGPDFGTFNYQLVAGTPPPALPPDTRAPLDHAFASHGAHGRVARLAYAAQDGRGVTADTVRVYRRGRLLRTIQISLSNASPFYVYDARWRVPRTVRGRLRFCVGSVDAARNKSNSSCAPLVIR